MNKGSVMLKSDGNGSFIVKKWFTIVSLSMLLLTSAYSFGVTFNIAPLRKQVIEHNERISDLKQHIIDLDKDVALDKKDIEYIKTRLDEIINILRK